MGSSIQRIEFIGNSRVDRSRSTIGNGEEREQGIKKFLRGEQAEKASQEKSRNTCLIPFRASRAKIRLRTTSKTSTGRSWAKQQLPSRHGAPGKRRNKTTLGGAHFEEAGRLGGRLGGRRAVRSDLLERGRRGEGRGRLGQSKSAGDNRF
jgi:hypothetical protein